jgi:LysR family hydrogen peroxide-inducible transcriptional activator
MELRQLRYFIAVAEMRSFTKAAARCGVSQPSLSQQIQKLERDVGQPLVDRLGRGLKLTEAGTALYERATAIVDAVDDARQHVQHGEDWQSGPVSIGAIHSIAPYLLPQVVARLCEQLPRARVMVEERLTEQLVERCLAGELDVAIVALPIAEPRVRLAPLFREKLLAALPSRSKLAKCKRLSLDDLMTEPFVLLDEMHCLGQQTLRLCTDHNCTPAVSCRTAQLLTVQEFVALGRGVSLVPEMAARGDRDRRRVYRPLRGTSFEREIAAMWRPRYRPKRLVEAVLEVLREFGRERANATH